MVATYRDVEVPARTHRECVSVTCDVCQTVHKDAEAHHDTEVDWMGHPYCGDTAKTHVFIIDEGFTSPSGGSGYGRGYHICPKCFKEELEPFLALLGAKPHKYSMDW